MERARQYLIARGGNQLADRIRVFTESSATVELAAQRLNCKPAHIAKSISFFVKVPVTREQNKKAQAQKQKAAASGDAGSSGAGSPTSPAGAQGDGQPGDHPVLIVAAGDAKVNAKKFKAKYGCTPKMFKREEVEEAIGYQAGGVCPFAVNPAVKVYLDVSLKRFETIYPACGSSNSCVPLTCAELEQYADNFVEWVDICDGWQQTEEAAPSADADAGPKAEENEAAKKEEA